MNKFIFNGPVLFAYPNFGNQSNPKENFSEKKYCATEKNYNDKEEYKYFRISKDCATEKNYNDKEEYKYFRISKDPSTGKKTYHITQKPELRSVQIGRLKINFK